MLVRVTQPHQLLRGQRQDAEHEMAEDLGMTAHPDCPAAVVVFDRAVDAFGRAALVEADGFGEFVTGGPLGLRLRRGFGLAARARIGVD